MQVVAHHPPCVCVCVCVCVTWVRGCPCVFARFCSLHAPVSGVSGCRNLRPGPLQPRWGPDLNRLSAGCPHRPPPSVLAPLRTAGSTGTRSSGGWRLTSGPSASLAGTGACQGVAAGPFVSLSISTCFHPVRVPFPTLCPYCRTALPGFLLSDS